MAIKKVECVCPECKHEWTEDVELPGRQREVDQFGYTKDSKGAFIATCIVAAGEEGVTVTDLRQKCADKFGTDCIARIRRVIHELGKKSVAKVVKASAQVTVNGSNDSEEKVGELAEAA